MNFDNSWDALLKPGDATVYFDVLSHTRFETEATSYSKINAWWLGELCRLIYRQGADEKPEAAHPTREEVLEPVGLHEVEFFNEKDSEAALIMTTPSAQVRYAALVFRGTNELMDWVTDFTAVPKGWAGHGDVHEGFAKALALVWDKVTSSLNNNVPPDCPLFIAGHSLGAALATLAASLRPPTALYTFGSPRVGDRDFAATLSGVNAFRVVNNRDAVTTVPPPIPFHHLGELHYITHEGGMLVDPGDEMVAEDRLKRDRITFFSRDWHKLFTDAPEPLADHAPVNYVAHLERMF
ncbi:MAG: lipase family protein [Blastocatellia bacterium]